MNRHAKSNVANEERMQSANKAFWKDILIYMSTDVPWKVKCQRLVGQVCAVFAFGSENWSWTKQTMETMKRLGNRDNVSLVPIQITQRRNMGRQPYKNVQFGKEDMDTDGLTLPI